MRMMGSACRLITICENAVIGCERARTDERAESMDACNQF
jgi:hypothetical protein